MSTEEKSASGGKVISGAVGAQAGAAGIAVGQGNTYTMVEHIHHRVAYNPANGEELGRELLTEQEVTSGETPGDFHRFTGIGTLRAEIPVAQGHPPQTHTEKYRYPVEGETLEEAWSLYQGCAQRGAEVAKADFRRRYAEFEKEARGQLVVPGGGSQGGLVGLNGQPLRPG